MAKLVKASTARRNADKADRAGVWISEIAEQINYAASIGEYETNKWTTFDILDSVTETLEAAGYTVRENTTTYIEVPLPRKRGFWAWLRDAIAGTRVEVQGVPSVLPTPSSAPDDFVSLNVGWHKGPYPEPEEPVVL